MVGVAMGREPETCLLERPNHYRPINPKSNRFADIIARMRIYGTWDVNTSVALDRLTVMQPSWRLTREFVRELLDGASQVSAADHDQRIWEVAHESWTYDCPGPRPSFDEYLASLRGELYRPDYDKKFRSDSQSLFAIDGLPTVYMLYEATRVEKLDEPLIHSRHFVDLGSVVVPIPLPSREGIACYIL
jgi:hypothetical protein